MEHNLKFFLILIVSALVLAGSASSARIAVVIEYPEGGTYKKCVTAEESANAYDVLKKSGIDTQWSNPGDAGHFLCAINDIGCPQENCLCSDKSWNFYIKEAAKDSWEYSMKLYDGGTSCDEHYCAKDGDMLGFAYGPYGTEPGSYIYKAICPPIGKETDTNDYTVTVTPDRPAAGEDITVRIEDSVSSEGIKAAEVIIYESDKKMASGETDGSGRFVFRVSKSDAYVIFTNVIGYDRPQRRTTIEVGGTPQPTVVTSSATAKQTTTAPQTTSTEEPTTTRQVATSAPATTSTTSPPATSTTTPAASTTTTPTATTSPATTSTLPETSGLIGNVVKYSAENPLAIPALLLILLAAYAVVATYQRGN